MRKPLFLSPLHSFILPAEEASDRSGLAASYEDLFTRSLDFINTHNDYGEWAGAITSAGLNSIGRLYKSLVPMVNAVNKNENSASRFSYYALSNLISDPANVLIPWAGASLITKGVKGFFAGRGAAILANSPKAKKALSGLALMSTEALGFEITHRLMQDLMTREGADWNPGEIALSTAVMTSKFAAAFSANWFLSKSLPHKIFDKIFKAKGEQVVLSNGTRVLNGAGSLLSSSLQRWRRHTVFI